MSTIAGSGHIKAAEALEASFKADPRVAEVINNDALQYTNKLFRDFYSKFYLSLVRSAPNFLGWWYKTSDEPWRTDRMRHMIDHLNTKPLIRFIRDFNPDITVCTHFMPAGLISHLIATQQIEAHLSIVVTDLDFHAMWLSRSFHRYFVALEETRVFLEKLGLPQERITVSGIPIAPVFKQNVGRCSERLRLGLDPQKPLLLLSAGTFGLGSILYIVESLKSMRTEVQVIVVCGKNLELQQQIEVMTQSNRSEFKVLGYTNEMHTLMHISDVFIGKPGGITVSEATACGLPICIVTPIPGQEERNSDHLLEEGIAIKCNELITLAYKLDRLFDEPERLVNMRNNALRFAKPDASARIVQTLLEDNLPPLSLNKAQRAHISLIAERK